MSSSPDAPANPAQHGAAAPDLEALITRALELRDEGRADWLVEACGADARTQADVRAAVERADAHADLIASASAPDPLRGRCLGGRFRIVERIGVGAMGVVYRALDLELGREVACKIVHHGLMAPEQALARFAREAEAMAAVQHPAVVTIFDRGETDGGQVYIVMELVDGPPVSAFLDAARERSARVRSDDASWIGDVLGVATRGETSCVRTVVRWVADLALGLEAVHRAGVLHRDIKPSNILLRRDGRPVLLDFGIALLDEASGGTRTATSLGTPAYMPPETLRRDAVRTRASDVYSLAATLYHLLTLHAPYEGTPTQILVNLSTRDPKPVAKLRPGLPRDLVAVLERGMQRNPARRYPSAAEFEADLRAFLEFRPVAARPVSWAERGWRHLSRSRAALGALAASLFAVIALGANAWRAHALDGRRAQLAAIASHYGPGFTTVGIANRVFRYDADRDAVAALLDAAAAVAVEPLPTFLLRASFRQDHGDPDGAASDMRRVAAFVDTPYARELAARYERATRHTPGVAALDLDNLPPLETPTDRYLDGYHWLRRDKYAPAVAALGDPEVRRIPHAEELFLALTDFDSVQGAERRRLAVERYADLVRLESKLGRRTAATAHIAARMLSMQKRHEEAARACADGIELAPRAYTLRINAGHCAFVRGHLDEAREHYAVARDMRPNYAHVVQNIAWVDVAEGRFDAAQQLVHDAEPGFVPQKKAWLDLWAGKIATYAALDAQATGDEAQRARQLELALTHFDAIADVVRATPNQPALMEYRIATALEASDAQALLRVLAESLAEDPEFWWNQQLLLRHLPAQLNESATNSLRRVIEALDPRTLDGSER